MRRRFAVGCVAAAGALLVPLLTAIGSSPVSATTAGGSRQITRSGTAAFTRTGGSAGANVAGPETVGGPGSDGPATDRSHSKGGSTPVGAIAQPRSVTNATPGLLTSFDGLNHFDNRFGSTAGANQFSLEPPDQGLCVGNDGHGNTRVLETLNDVLRVYDTAGHPLTDPQALNPFLGYAPAVNRSTVTFGPFVTDPSCLYDAATGHWFLDVLTLDTFPQPGSDGAEHYTGTNHIDLAVSDTSDPAGSWTIYRVPVQDDGTNGTPNHGCSAATPSTTPPATPLPTNPHACLGDYPHIGADANGIFVTTNEYSFFGPEFHGAQVYALSKAQLAARPSAIDVVQFDTHGLDTFGFAQNGFTLWPSTTPGGGGDSAVGGSEYFLSSNAAAEAHDPGNGMSSSQPSTQLLVWALTNTASLGGSGTPHLRVTKVDVPVYAPPPPATQKAGQQPLRDCLNNKPCSTALEGIADPFPEKSAPLDSNDTRMQQVTWVNGQLWGALDTALSISSGKQAGVEWFDVAPTSSPSSLAAAVTNTGYLGLGNANLIYPAIGVTGQGTGVMAFTLVGPNFYPSAGYAPVTKSGVGDVHIAAAGAGPEDGFSNYKLFGDPAGTTRPRWGDYGAAVPVGSNVWIASEYIGQSCSFSTFQQSGFVCGGTRTALANWGTRISEVAAP